MDIVKTRVTLKMSFSKNCGTLKNTEVYKMFVSCWLLPKSVKNCVTYEQLNTPMN